MRAHGPPVLRRLRPWLRALTPRTLALFGVAIVASIGFAILAAEMRAGALDRLDRAVELAIHRLDAEPSDLVLVTATWIGADVVLLPAVAVVTALAVRMRRRTIAIVLVIDAIVVITADSALKLLFSRERPRLFDKIALPTSYSFPSGHSMSALGIYGVLAAALIALYPRARRPVIAATIALIALIGLSRVYLGVHWPSDVIGGWLAGVPPLVVSVHLIHHPARDR
ncbi:MAG TPA: phosphatase PAP2 family protein [Kofleriaceae bacterium]|jgi:undecaprenyl-diphosphatase|nr:phosphatase PAP2 family protein [Kofleriaceae bacterium]